MIAAAVSISAAGAIDHWADECSGATVTVCNSAGTTRKAAFAWDALRRRLELINDVLAGTSAAKYYHDGVSEVAE